MSELVTCKDLTKRFGNHTALDHLNLSLDSGKIIGLLGPNGSGKTTLLKLLNGLLTPSEGEVLIAGNHPGIETKRIVSYLPDKMYLGSWMRVSDLLTYYSDFFEDFDMSRANAMLESLKNQPEGPFENDVEGNERESPAHPHDEPPRKALLPRRADCRRRSGSTRLHFIYDFKQLRTRRIHPHLNASDFRCRKYSR